MHFFFERKVALRIEARKCSVFLNRTSGRDNLDRLAPAESDHGVGALRGRHGQPHFLCSTLNAERNRCRRVKNGAVPVEDDEIVPARRRVLCGKVLGHEAPLRMSVGINRSVR